MVVVNITGVSGTSGAGTVTDKDYSVLATDDADAHAGGPLDDLPGVITKASSVLAQSAAASVIANNSPAFGSGTETSYAEPLGFLQTHVRALAGLPAGENPVVNPAAITILTALLSLLNPVKAIGVVAIGSTSALAVSAKISPSAQANTQTSVPLFMLPVQPSGAAGTTGTVANIALIPTVAFGVLITFGVAPLYGTKTGGQPTGVAGTTSANATATPTFKTVAAAAFTAASTLALTVAPYFSGTPGLVSGISSTSAGGPAFAGIKFSIPGTGSALSAGVTSARPGGQPPTARITTTAGRFFLNPLSAQVNAMAGNATFTFIPDPFQFTQIDMVATLNTLSIWTFGG